MWLLSHTLLVHADISCTFVSPPFLSQKSSAGCFWQLEYVQKRCESSELQILNQFPNAHTSGWVVSVLININDSILTGAGTYIVLVCRTITVLTNRQLPFITIKVDLWIILCSLKLNLNLGCIKACKNMRIHVLSWWYLWCHHMLKFSRV